MAREQWGSRFGFVLAAAGSAVGLGNLWRFPYVTYENGGGSFVLMYVAAVALVGFPLLVAEMLLGKASQRNAVGAFRFFERVTTLPLHYHRKDGKAYFPGFLIGAMGILTGFIILSWYTVIAGWTLEYAIRGLGNGFSGMTMQQSVDIFTDFVEHPAKQVGYFAVFILITIVIIARGVTRGIEALNRILLPALFFLVMGLGLYSMVTFEATPTIEFLFQWDLSTITPATALAALGQAFFSLSLGMGAILTYGSYLRKNQSIFNSAAQVAIADSAIALLACFVMYPIVLSNTEALKDFSELSMLFTTLPVILAKLPAGSFVVGLFYVLVAFAAITSTVSLLEVVVAYWVDEKRWSRKKAAWILGLVIFLFGIPSALSQGASPLVSSVKLLSKGGKELAWLASMDYLSSDWLLPLGGLLIALFTAWYLLKKEQRDNLIGDGDSRWVRFLFGGWQLLIRYVTPILIFLVLLYSVGAISPGK